MSEEKYPKLKNTRFIKACFGEKTDKTPIFIHRQAGRYLPEYRKLKNNRDFFTLCQTPKIASDLTLQPIARFDLDAAIIFSDILVIPQAIGFEVQMIPGKGPYFPNPLDIKNTFELSFKTDLCQKLKYVYEAITLTRNRLNGKVPLIGFTGGPWTLLCYLIEGKSDKNLVKAKKCLVENPTESLFLLKNLSNLIVRHLILQVKAGAHVVEVFDTLSGYLSKEQFLDFVLPFLKSIVNDFKEQLVTERLGKVPIILFPKGANHSLKGIAETGCDVVSIDWNVSPETARESVGLGVTLMGNLNPLEMYKNEEELKEEVIKMVKGFRGHRYIANLGHGMRPDMTPEAVAVFVETVHSVKFD